ATRSSAEGVQYATVVEAIAAAVTGDVITLHGQVLWGGAAYDAIPSTDATAVTILGAEGASLVPNGANGRLDSTPNITYLPCGITFSEIVIEESRGMNFIFANGYPLEITNSVTFEYKGSETSGEIASCAWSVFGGSDLRDVEQASLTLNAGDYRVIAGGGFGKSVAGDVTVSASNVTGTNYVYGGSLWGDVGGNVALAVDAPSLTMMAAYGGCYLGNVGGNVDMRFCADTIFSVYGGGHKGAVTGAVSLTLAAGANVDCPVLGGGSKDGLEPIDSNLYDMYIALKGKLPTREDFAGDCSVGSTSVTMGGSCIGLFGGGDGPVMGDTHVTVTGTGTVTAFATMEGVFGGGMNVGADVGGSTYVTIDEGASLPRELKKLSDREPSLWGGMVIGGGRFSKVAGDTHVTLNGKIGSELYGGMVLGGGYTSSSDNTPDVGGTAYVTVNAAPYAYTAPGKLDWMQFGSYDGMDGANGIYGGGFNYVGTNHSQITINTELGAVPVYGGGFLANTTGTAKVILAPGSGADTVYGGGDYSNMEAGVVASSEILVQDGARVGTIYGYETIPDGRTVAGSAAVIFDGTGSAGAPATVERIINADSVSVTNGAHVNLSSTTDYDQLQNVVDLTVNENAVLNLAANTHILGNYSGSAAADTRGTLGIVAGKKLIADGTASGHTALNVTDPQLAALHQVYVAALGGSTADSFTWEDAQNRFTLVQGTPAIEGANANLTGEELATLSAIAGEKADKWWLIAAPARPDPTPDPRPDPRPDPKPTPIIPVNPVNPVTPLPDEEIPLAPLPSTPELPREELPDEEVPLAEAPQTGDNLSLWLTLLSASALGLAAVLLADKRRKEEQ
ncbi:MAG: LPXTG cell wall anchor domain-containing protein, partial [Oscillospiraceae bacterium]